MSTAYSPSDFESELYQRWESRGLFRPRGNGPAFSVVIPPPNVTGILHMGHALNMTLQDILVRYHRMKGDRVLWVPGSDHAGIATQNVVERQLKDEKLTRYDLGREAFIKRVWQWKAEYGGQITTQIRRLGASVDWMAERFTMDPDMTRAVRHHFVTLYEQGYIYRGRYIINWCPRCRTALSDIEVAHEEKVGHLWHIAYRGEHAEIVVATTRPETLFGDLAIAVHTQDDRYRHLIGRTVRVPFTNRDIPIIGDTAVDPAFGTGAVKVTPAHDPNDFEIGQRHQLSQLVVMDESGAMNDQVPPTYRGLDRADCRAQLVKDLERRGDLISTQDHRLSVGHCSRCKTIVEPYLSYQWFVRMRALAQPAITAVASDEIQFYPKGRWEKLYFNWMENIRDWCISRQIWWGHQIPVWYCACSPEHPIVTEETPAKCPHCHGQALTQDPDVLDTWFSSALWPFSTLGWPQKSEELKTYYPTSVLVTGYDIITFWVSRMIVMGLFQMKQKPFCDVYIHGLVRDKDGKKMSKSVGNVIDPLALIEAHGADALRYCLASLSTLGGQDIKFSEDRLLAGKHFANKLWNASRFVQMSVDESTILPSGQLPSVSHVADRWILSRLAATLQAAETHLATYHFAALSEVLWEFTWNEFCDWYLEMAKSRKSDATPTLVYVLVNILKILHPVMPFVSEALWQSVFEKGWVTDPDLIVAAWPELSDLHDEDATQLMSLTMSVVREIRHVRKAVQVAPSVRCKVILEAPDRRLAERLKEAESLICQLAGLSDCEVVTALPEVPRGCAASVAEQIKIYLPLAGVIDLDKERQRLKERQAKLKTEITRLEARLANTGFVSKAPAAAVIKIRDQLSGLQGDAEKLREQLTLFGG